jgi:hypothetical protein
VNKNATWKFPPWGKICAKGWERKCLRKLKEVEASVVLVTVAKSSKQFSVHSAHGSPNRR